MSQVKYGIIGAGAIAHISVKCIQNHGQSTIVGAFDLNKQCLVELCNAFDIGHAYETADVQAPVPALTECVQAMRNAV